MPFDTFVAEPTLEVTGCGPLTIRALQGLDAMFETSGHRPSPTHRDALKHILMTLEAMADGNAIPGKIYLSAIDPGVGKTQSVVHFARTLTTSSKHRDVGMLICVGRIAEAQQLALDLGETVKPFLAVLTSHPDEDAKLSGAEPDHAQVLITTQQRIEKAAAGGSFEALASFHFHGRPRAVRVWDEAWLPGAVAALTGHELMSLLAPLDRDYPALANALEAFADRLRQGNDNDLVEVPDFEAETGVSMAEVLATFSAPGKGSRGRAGVGDGQRQAATSLAILSGRTARIRQDGTYGRPLLAFRDTLPTDFYPLLVLDASGRVRQTYQDVEDYRGMVIRLKTAAKDYSPLTVFHWQTSGSKDGWKRNEEELTRGIADMIMSKPDQSWLVVAHKPRKALGDLRRKLSGLLPVGMVRPEGGEGRKEPGGVHVITWGQHMATNDYADVQNVILAGTLFMRDSHYTGLTNMARGHDVARGFASEDDIRRTREGEHAHNILQAICRGRVRKLDGDKCLPMNAYLIAAKRSRIGNDLRRIFPGCKVKPWRGGQQKLPPKLQAAMDFVEDQIAAGNPSIPCTAIQKAIGVDRTNFPKLVTKRPEWEDFVADHGLRAMGSPRRLTGYQTA